MLGSCILAHQTLGRHKRSEAWRGPEIHQQEIVYILFSEIFIAVSTLAEIDFETTLLDVWIYITVFLCGGFIPGIESATLTFNFHYLTHSKRNLICFIVVLVIFVTITKCWRQST